MKILLSGSVLFLVILFSIGPAGLSSCTKDKTIIETIIKKDTVIIRDTVYIRDTVVTAEILTSRQWKIQELRGVNEGSVLYYLRGGSNNTDNYDNEYIVFNANKTGFEVDNIFITRQIPNWTLSGNQITKLTFTYNVTPTISMVITWDNLRFKNNALYYDEYYSNPVVGNDFHGQGIRIAK